MEQKLTEYLGSRGYRQLPSSMAEVHIYFRVDGDLAMAVLVLDARRMILTVPAFRQIRSQVGQMFQDKGYSSIRIFTLFLVSNLESGRLLGSSDPMCWVLDLGSDRLCIFENAVVDFDRLRSGLEELLLEDAAKRGISPKSVAAWLKDGFFRSRAPVTLCLILLNSLVFLAVSMGGSTEDVSYMISRGAMVTRAVTESGELYRFFTCMFLHFGLEHLTANMLALWIFGSRVEQALGRGRYLALYLICGLTGSATSFAVSLAVNNGAASAGASGAVFGVIGALFAAVIRNRGKFGDITMARAVWLVAYSVFSGVSARGVDNAAHIGGLIAGLVLCFLLFRGLPDGAGFRTG